MCGLDGLLLTSGENFTRQTLFTVILWEVPVVTGVCISASLGSFNSIVHFYLLQIQQREVTHCVNTAEKEQPSSGHFCRFMEVFTKEQ